MHAHFAKAQINGITLSYRMLGTGLPLLLLHGGLGNADYWDKKLIVFAETYKVIAIDSRGHGRSTFTEEPISYALMAADVIALLDTLGIERADVVGWSDGGMIGLDLAIHHPERLHKLIAYGANYNPSGLRADVSQNAKFNNYIAKAAEDYQQVAPDPLRWDAFLENISKMWATEPNYTPAQLATVATPTLILDGEEKELIEIKHVKEMVGLIPIAKLLLVAGVGYFAPWEQPQAFNQIVLDFLMK